jgi:DNA-binding winged helix-turn-helix (wHTH) protein
MICHRSPRADPGSVQTAFRIGELHQVEPSLNRVTGPTGTTRLEPKVMQVLVCLAEHAGDVVSKERLILVRVGRHRRRR